MTSPTPPATNLETLVFHTLLQLGVVIIAARLAGRVALSAGQPRAVGEIVVGLMLGPSLFGRLSPEAFSWIFKSVDSTPITVMSQIGLIMLMFQVGMEFDFAQLSSRSNKRAVTLVTLFGLILPFSLGFGFGHWSQSVLAPTIDPIPYCLFLGVSFAITAVPILGRILMEFKLTTHRIGVVTIAAAAANDAIGWILLAFVSAYVTQGLQLAASLQQFGLLLAYVLGSWVVIRQILHRIVHRFGIRAQSLPQDLLAILLVIIFGSAMLTSRLGIFAIFGGFMMGVLLHDQRALADAWNHKVADLVAVLFLPIFFTYTGLRTDVGSLAEADLWGWCAALIGLAVIGKIGGAYLAARLAGFPKHEAQAIGVLMNTRALMELIVVNLGYDLGVIPRPVFTMLVLMAITSTLMTAPGLRICFLRRTEAH